MPGMGELLIILLIVLLIFGAGKLPAIGESLGRSIRNFKRSAQADDEIEVSKKKEIEKGSGKELDEADDADVIGSKRKKAKSDA
jgi:sec-independent protein translocase protein TatA